MSEAPDLTISQQLERATFVDDDGVGTPQNPITQDELIEKFLHNAQGVLDDAAAHAAIDRILDLDRAADLREVFAPLSGLRR